MKKHFLIGLITSVLMMLVFALTIVNEAQAAPPNFQAAGTPQASTGSVTVTWPAHQVDDIALLFVESRAEDNVAAPAGFTAVAGSFVRTIATTTNGTRLSVFWARATSTSMPNVTVTDPGTFNHLIAQILTYRGVTNIGNPWDVTGAWVDNTSDNSVNATGVTTTVIDTLVVVAVAEGVNANSTAMFNNPGSAGGWANANLTGIAERADYTRTNNDGGGFGVIDGVKAATGATGITTVTMASNFRKAALTIVLKPAGPPSKLAFIQQPTNTQAGATISPAIVVEVQDANGARVYWDNSTSVAIAIGSNPSGGTLSGTTPVTVVAGRATFSNLSINMSGVGYTLNATAAGLTGATSNAFNILTGAATKLGFLQQPANTQACATISPAVTVAIQDSAGNTVTSATNAVTIAIGTNPGSGTLSGTLTVNAVAGVATFSDLSINKSGTGYTLNATAGGLTGATSNAFNITAGPANKLAFVQQPPASAIYNQVLSPAVTCEITDSPCGARVDTGASVTMSIGNNPSGGTLRGTTTKSASSGLATFDDLYIGDTESVAGSGYTLVCSSSGLTSATSNAFNITTGAYGLTQCAGSRYGSDLGCTAGDVSITGIAARPGSPTSCVGGESIILNLDVTVNVGGPARWDVGIFLSNDGLDPKDTPASGGSNSCSVAILPFLPDPFRNLDGDGCGDIDKPPDSGVLQIDNVLLKCTSATGLGGNLSVPFVVSWDNQASPSGGTCNSIANPVPNTTSKCNKPSGTLGSVNVVVLPTITNTDNKTTPAPEESISKTVVITNTTGDTLTGAVFKDTVDPTTGALTLTSATCCATGGATCPCGAAICGTSTCSVSTSDMQGAGLPIPPMPNNSSLTFIIDATVSATPPATFTNAATVTVGGTATASASDTVGGSGSGSGGSRIKIIKWREVFQ